MATLDLMNLLDVDDSKFVLEHMQEHSETEGGDIISAELGPSRWYFEFSVAILTLAKANQIQAEIGLLRGSLFSFYAWNPAAQYPQSDPTGSIIGSSAVKIKSVGSNNKSLALKALPVGYVLTKGDFLAFDYTSGVTKRALHQVVALSTTANGSGETTEFEIHPPFRSGVAADLDVNLKKPAAEFKLVPRSFDPRAVGVTGSLSLKGSQVL